MKTKFFLGAFAAMMLHLTGAYGQQHYSFSCRDYVSTDNARAPQDRFAYDEAVNTFTVNASGTNNVAFKMADGQDGEYFIDPDQTLYLVSGSNLSVNAGESKLWWMNGFNNPGSNPDYTLSEGDGRKLFVWDLKTNTAVNGGFNFSQPQVSITSNGAGFIMAMGLTAADATQPGVITDVNYYAPCEAASLYSTMKQQLGYTDETLTVEVKLRLESMITRAEAKYNAAAEGEGKNRLGDAIQSARNVLSAMSATDYLPAYQALVALRKATDNFSQTNHTYSYETTGHGILAKWDDMNVNICFYKDDVVRIGKAYDTSYQKPSLVVLGSPSDVSFTVSEREGIVSVKTAKMTVEYTLLTGIVTIKDGEGRQLISEQSCSMKARKDGPNDSYTVMQRFQLASDERIYGMGQLQDGRLNRRNTSVKLEQDNRSICIPYFESSKNYGLYWDNYSPTTFSDSEAGTRFTSTGTAIDYYVLVADDSRGVLRSLRALTGECKQPALWNFGLYQSKQRYTSAQEVMDVLGEYRRRQVPIDCMVQDWQYWGDDAHWNAMEFLNPTFSNYQAMLDYVHQNNAKLMISFWPDFGPQTRQYAEFQSKGMLLTGNSYPWNAGCRPYDPYSAEARDIYWNYLYNGLVRHGIDAYWMDSTEPDYQGGTDADFDCVTGWNGQTWRALRNAFPLATVEGVYQHHRAQSELNDKRVSIMTRSGYLGMQRTGAYVWSADITSSWETLANQIPAALNLSATGLPYWNSDTGAFFIGGYKGGVSNDQWRRLYTRWTQFSTFCPMLRFHGDQTPREIWQFGDQGDVKGEYDNLVKYIRLRYRMLPYLYATARQCVAAAGTMMTALPLAFEDDAQGYDVQDQYMFGDAMMVAPVIQDKVNGRDVYLPAGHRWYDFWTGTSTDGGKRVYKKTPADIIPVYVKAGSILPWGPDVQYSTEKSWDNLEIRVYAGADGQFTLYEDENDNYNYEQGKYSEILFSWDDATQTLTIDDRHGAFSGMLQDRTFRIVRVSSKQGVGDLHSTIYKEVSYDGHRISIELGATPEIEEVDEDITSEIVNPSFEGDNSTLTMQAPQGWTVTSTTTWWGVNDASNAASTSDPLATDGRYVFGVWDGSNSLTPTISQTLSHLPAGFYRLSVDMQASNRANGVVRLGTQHVFAGASKGYFRDQITSAGVGDDYPMHTICVDFEQKQDNEPVTIGVSTEGATAETWFKIDNFRLVKRPVHIRQTAADGFGTICLPRQAMSPDVTVYKVVGVNGTRLSLDPLAVNEYMEPGKPYFYQAADQQQTFTMTGDAVSSPVASTGLVGTFVDIIAPQGTNFYVLSGNKLYQVNSEVKVGANRAYVDLSSVQGSREGSVYLDLSTTTQSVTSHEYPREASAFYDLMGRQVSHPENGIYVSGNKKLYVK